MHGLWKSKLGKSFYSKDCRIKNNKRKHFLNDKSRAVNNRRELMSKSKQVIIFSNNIYTSSNVEINRKRSLIKVPVIETTLIGSNGYELKRALVFYDFFSEVKGFREYYSNVLLVKDSDIFKRNKLSNRWIVEFKLDLVKGIKVPLALGVESEIELIKPLLIINYERSLFDNSHVEFFYGKLRDSEFIHKYYPFSKKYCKKIANRSGRVKSKVWTRKVKLDIELYNESYPTDYDLIRSISYCIS